MTSFLKHINILTSYNSSSIANFFSKKLQLPEFWSKITDCGTHTAFACGATHFVVSEPGDAAKSSHDKSFIFADLYGIHVDTRTSQQKEQLSYGRLNSVVNLTISVDKSRFNTLQSKINNSCSLLNSDLGSHYNTNLISTPLPGFSHLFLHQDGSSIDSQMRSDYGLDGALFSNVDHVLCAVDEKSFEPAMSFYTKELEFERFYVSPNDENELGLKVEAGFGDGLVMKTMSFCESLEIEMSDQSSKTKIMLARSLNPSSNDNLCSFLSNNANHAGCQHIALQTQDICKACETLRSNGIEFIDIPQQYYNDRNWRYKVESLGMSADSLQAHGVLCDWDISSTASSAKDGNPNYILQIFTKPVFGTGFFLEIIERSGAAKGFGENNIKSLWNAQKDDRRVGYGSA